MNLSSQRNRDSIRAASRLLQRFSLASARFWNFESYTAIPPRKHWTFEYYAGNPKWPWNDSEVRCRRAQLLIRGQNGVGKSEAAKHIISTANAREKSVSANRVTHTRSKNCLRLPVPGPLLIPSVLFERLMWLDSQKHTSRNFCPILRLSRLK